MKEKMSTSFYLLSPLILVWSAIYGFVMGLFCSAIGHYEQLKYDIANEYSMQKHVPEYSHNRYKNAVLANAKDRKEWSRLKIEFEEGIRKEPPPLETSKAYTLEFILLLPYTMISNAFFWGPIRAFEDAKYCFLRDKPLHKEMEKRIKEAATKVGKKLPKVLVVDDNVDITNLLVEKINDTGRYQTIKANSVDEATVILKETRRFLGYAKNKIQLLILDIDMHNDEEAGLKLLHQWRSPQKRLNLIPAIMLTAFKTGDFVAKATAPTIGQVAGYIQKPPDETALIDLIDRIIQNNETEYLIDITSQEGYEFRTEEYKKNARSDDLG